MPRLTFTRLIALFLAFCLMRSGRALMVLGAMLLGVGGCGAAGALVERAEQALEGRGAERARLVRVSGGDTIVVRVGGRERRVRLLGLDSPESNAQRYGAASCGDKAAKAFVIRALFRRAVDRDGDRLADTGTDPRPLTLIADRRSAGEDKYGRVLRYVKVRGARPTLQERILVAGWAAVVVHGNERFARLEAFRRAERTARRHRRGIYSACDGEVNPVAV